MNTVRAKFQNLHSRNRIIGTGALAIFLAGGITLGAIAAAADEADAPSITAEADPQTSGNNAEQNGPRNGRRGHRGTPIDPATVSVTEEQASAAAIAAVGGGEVTRASLRASREEGANPVWRVSVTNGEERFKVTVDAETGVASDPVARTGEGRRGHRQNGPGNGTGQNGAGNGANDTVEDASLTTLIPLG